MRDADPGSSSPETPKDNMRRRVISGVVLTIVGFGIVSFGGWALAIILLLALGLSLREWWGLARGAKKPVLSMLSGLIYLPLVFACFYMVRELLPAGGFYLAVALVMTVAVSDMGAYFTGKTIGGKKLWPSISPKKTWAGFGGAIFWAGSILALILAGSLFNSYLQAHFDLQGWMILPAFLVGGMMGAFGQAGDLLVSYLKRRAHIKDAGHLIPGHGGLLDRIDSLMFVTPFYLLVIWLWLG